LFWSNLFW